MRIKVLLFAAAREAAESDCLEVEVVDDACARDVIDAVGKRLPQISRILPSCRLAVDCEYVGPDTSVSSTSEIALIPPVSGG